MGFSISYSRMFNSASVNSLRKPESDLARSAALQLFVGLRFFAMIRSFCLQQKRVKNALFNLLFGKSHRGNNFFDMDSRQPVQRPTKINKSSGPTTAPIPKPQARPTRAFG